jgi:selenocysteine lyase/cysteine desulfurase
MTDVTNEMDVDRLRADTPGCANVTHLNNAGAALPPASVTQAMVDHLRREEAIGGYEAQTEAAERIEGARASVAALVGARPDQIALVESATHAWTRGLAAIHHTRPLTSADRILVSSEEYASNVLPMMQLAASTGARLEFVPDGPDGSLDAAALRDMLDDDVAIVAINHCPSQNGLVNDVEAIGDAVRQTTAWYIVDACQSVGQMPVDATAMGADFLSATGRKFLRGPRGTGFLYASERALADLEPFPLDLHSATWTSEGYEVQSTARRYEYWEKSYAAILGLGAAVDYALALGLEAIAERIGMLAGYARARLADVEGVVVRDRGTMRSGIVTLTKNGVPAADIVARLKAAGVNVSLSTPDYSRIDFDRHGVDGLVRISPHVFSTTDEIDRAVDVIASAD